MLYYLGIGLALGLVLGCATPVKEILPPAADLLPPEFEVKTSKDRESIDYFLLKLAESQSSRETNWWTKYKRATLWKEANPKLSCTKYLELAKDPLFPLAQVAYLRANEVCPEKSEELQSMAKFKPSRMPSWMQKTALEVALKRAELDGSNLDVMNLSYEKSKEYLPQEEKARLTLRALELAKELQKDSFATKMQERVYQLAPRLNPHPSKREWLEVAYDFRRQREFDRARDFYRKVIASSSFKFYEKLKAHYGIRKAYKNERDKKSYLKATRAMAKFTEKYFRRYPKSDYYRRKFHDAHITLCRTEWTLGQVKAAKRTLAKIERKLRYTHTMAEVFWLFGRMEEEAQNFEKAHYWFERALKQPIKDREFREKILWYKAWNERKTKQLDLAIQSFTQLRDNTDNDFAKSRYHFWLAKSYEDKGDEARANLEYQALINEDPLGYYGLVSHRQTQQLIPANEEALKRIPSSETSLFTTEDEMKRFIDVQLVEWLISLDEHDLSRRYLDEISATYRKRKDQSEKTWLKIFNYYARSGEYLSLYEQLGKLSAERRKHILDSHPSLIFPRPFTAIVNSASEKHGVSPELIYSIMRQESAFNPRARSFADAFGLLQMLPENARKQAAKINVQFEKAEDLYDPEINIPLGAAFIREISEKWNNQFILTVASYNANDRAIRGWLQTRYRGDPLEFIEDIPYEETRGYVRLVMRNLIFYSLLAAKGEKIPFPQWVLELEPPRSV